MNVTVKVSFEDESGVVSLHERTFTVVETDAPCDYDGFGSLEMEREGTLEGDGHPHHIGDTTTSMRRVMLVDVKHFEWQTARYRSGMFVVRVPPGTEVDLDDVAAFFLAPRRC